MVCAVDRCASRHTMHGSRDRKDRITDMAQDKKMETALWTLETAIARLRDGQYLRAVLLVCDALPLSYSLWKQAESGGPEEVQRGFARIAQGLSKMHTPVLREAVRMLDHGGRPSAG